MSIVTVGIGLAKTVFAVPDVDDNGKAALVKPATAQGIMRASSGVDRATAAVRDRHGSLLRCAPLGGAVPGAWPHRKADRAQVRHALSGKRGKNATADAASPAPSAVAGGGAGVLALGQGRAAEAAPRERWQITQSEQVSEMESCRFSASDKVCLADGSDHNGWIDDVSTTPVAEREA